MPKQRGYFVRHVAVAGARDELRKDVGIGLNAHAPHNAENFFDFAQLLGAAVRSNDLNECVKTAAKKINSK